MTSAEKLYFTSARYGRWPAKKFADDRSGPTNTRLVQRWCGCQKQATHFLQKPAVSSYFCVETNIKTNL